VFFGAHDAAFGAALSLVQLAAPSAAVFACSLLLGFVSRFNVTGDRSVGIFDFRPFLSIAGLSLPSQSFAKHVKSKPSARGESFGMAAEIEDLDDAGRDIDHPLSLDQARSITSIPDRAFSFYSHPDYREAPARDGQDVKHFHLSAKAHIWEAAGRPAWAKQGAHGVDRQLLHRRLVRGRGGAATRGGGGPHQLLAQRLRRPANFLRGAAASR